MIAQQHIFIAGFSVLRQDRALKYRSCLPVHSIGQITDSTVSSLTALIIEAYWDDSSCNRLAFMIRCFESNVVTNRI